MVDVPVNRSDKLQQFTFVVGVLCRKLPSFHRRRLGVLFGHSAWFDSGYMICVSPGRF